MLEKVISKEMTNALEEVVSNILEGRRTAAHSSLSLESAEAFKSAYRDLRAFLKESGSSLPLAESALSIGMGNWISSGWVFPHIWGALFPAEGNKASGEVPQLFVIRKPDVLRWGICLSTRSQGDRECVTKISSFLQDQGSLSTLLERGFKLENDSSLESHTKPTALVKTREIAEVSASMSLAQEIQQDLQLLFPHFVELVQEFREADLIGGEEEEETSNDDELKEDKRLPGVSYWVIAPGEGARLWKECLENGIISIGWDEMGELKALGDREALREHYIKLYSPSKTPMNNSKALYEFANAIKIGDVIFAKEGQHTLVGVGTVTSDYIFDPSRKEHKHIRKVQWDRSGDWRLEERLAVKAVTNITRYSEFVNRLIDATSGRSVTRVTQQPNVVELYTPELAEKDLFVEHEQFLEMLESLRLKQNIILQGPPGVGKTFVAERLAYGLIGSRSKSCLEFVQFHPSYSYEDFIQGYRPNGESFELQNGVFIQFCNRARTSPEQSFVLIIDEINRGNLSKIFGELLILIEADKRGKDIKLTYSRENDRFSVPENVFIIGTMNTADRSLSPVDYALRRRFSFFDIKPAFASKKFAESLTSQGLTESEIDFLRTRVASLNKKISKDLKYLGPGFEIGHSYFCTKAPNQAFHQWYFSVLKNEIAPLLREYWFDDQERAEAELAALKVHS